MDEINDVNRMLKHKVSNFKTIFIRYRAKNDVNLIKEKAFIFVKRYF